MINTLLTPEARTSETEEAALAAFFNTGEGPEMKLPCDETAAFDIDRYTRGRSRYVGNPRTEDPDAAYYILCEMSREQGANNLGRIAIGA